MRFIDQKLGLDACFTCRRKDCSHGIQRSALFYKRAKKLVKEENSIKIEVKRANAKNFRLRYSELAGTSNHPPQSRENAGKYWD